MFTLLGMVAPEPSALCPVLHMEWWFLCQTSFPAPSIYRSTNAEGKVLELLYPVSRSTTNLTAFFLSPSNRLVHPGSGLTMKSPTTWGLPPLLSIAARMVLENILFYPRLDKLCLYSSCIRVIILPKKWWDGYDLCHNHAGYLLAAHSHWDAESAFWKCMYRV